MTPQRGTQNYNLTSIGASIKQRWKSNTNIIPPYIIKLLKIRRHDIKPADVLFNGFFAEATSPPKGNVSLIQISCLVDFFQSPSTHLIQAIRDILTPGEPHSIINDLVDITIQSKSPHFKFISTKDRNNAPALFSSHVISSIEYTFLSKSFRTIDNLQYIPYATKPKNLIVEDSIHNLKEVTMVKSNFKPEVSLRHLLKKSDSIPYFSETPLGLTTEGFVNAYLVQMGPPETLLSRQEEANMLNMLCGFDNEANLIRTLSKVVLERKKEIRALSAYTSITTSILSIGQLTSDTRIRVFNVLLHYLIYTELFKSNNNINNEQRTIQYMNDPKLFLDDYQQIIIKGKNELPKYLITKTYPEICYSILTSSFNFQYFQETHSELSEYDNQLSSIISTMATPFVQEQFPLPTEPYDVNKKPKKVILRELVEKLRDEFEIWENIILAFMEINPIRKISLLKNAFDMVYKYFSTNCPPSMELGADEYTPIFITCFLYSNPYGMLSNYVFINDFACAQVFGGMFSYPTSQMMASCKSIFQSAMPNEELTRFCKIEL
ncbi:hypothetical protein GPJ56_007333 [Histomonas meleagridis]|uniref:uncharacterized protein n=1 Tax=Histomonas meleagridis TaxID=135588 RepID=UPI00355A37FE|nr:hypothetical protein GPJ56_007333 [Histomonas meleagridis]KAH0804179.1 hypothetical protein GO595_003009 [Histomonas meleagridis]